MVGLEVGIGDDTVGFEVGGSDDGMELAVGLGEGEFPELSLAEPQPAHISIIPIIKSSIKRCLIRAGRFEEK